MKTKKGEVDAAQLSNPKLVELRLRSSGAPKLRTWTSLYEEDLLLLRTLYPGRGTGSYTHHIRECVHQMCNILRQELREQGLWDRVQRVMEAEKAQEEGDGQEED